MESSGWSVAGGGVEELEAAVSQESSGDEATDAAGVLDAAGAGGAGGAVETGGAGRSGVEKEGPKAEKEERDEAAGGDE